MPKATEIAELTVNGVKFSDWESVLVRHAIKEQIPFRFRFTCSEGMPLAKNWALMRIRPGDVCSISLAGILAITGKVLSRQVYYDKQRHHIEIQGGTLQEMSTTSVVSKTMEWTNITFEQLASAVLKPLNISLKVIGGSLPSTNITRASATHGESVYDFLDHYARMINNSASMGISFTSNPQGDFVVVVGPAGGSDIVTEGVNILEGREIIYNPDMVGNNATVNQGPGNNKTWGAQVASVPFFSQTFQKMGTGSTGPSVVMHEVPEIVKEHMAGRSNNERNWQEEDQITVFATVQGWLKPSGGLWQRDQPISVISPMLIMKGSEGLITKSVTFTQENATGTRTVLECCNAQALKGLESAVQGGSNT